MDPSQLSFFGYGVLLGLAAACWVAFSAWRKRRDLALEVGRLRRHLHDQMEISHEGAEQRKLELERLRKENENLRIAIKSWQQKPNRQELRQLMVYDRAVREIAASAPGFSAHWENALKAAELEVQQMDQGLLAFARRLVQPAKRAVPPRDE